MTVNNHTKYSINFTLINVTQKICIVVVIHFFLYVKNMFGSNGVVLEFVLVFVEVQAMPAQLVL